MGNEIEAIEVDSLEHLKFSNNRVITKPEFRKLSRIVLQEDNLGTIMSTLVPSTPQISSSKENMSIKSFADEPDQAEEHFIEQIKVKWNSFIKIKRKNFEEEYQIIKHIGNGSSGTVFKVKSRQLNSFRAAKQIKKVVLGSSSRNKLFLEMVVMSKLDHPNIAKLFQVYECQKNYVLIMELCEGGQLFTKIMSFKRMNEDCIKMYMQQIIKTLLYLHSKGIIHRDIKPQNMLLSADHKCVKIIDFGIAVQASPEDILNECVGTPYYLAPEVIQKQYNHKCDIWAAGITMYLMLTKKPPFRGNSIPSVLAAITSNDLPITKDIIRKYSPACLEFMKCMLVKNPAKRIAATELYNHKFISNTLPLNMEVNQDVISRINNFKFKNKFEAVIYTYIVSQVLSSEEKAEISQIFESLDVNHDGVISILELRSFLQKSTLSQARIQTIMSVIDTNSSGYIDLTEFVVAGMRQESVGTKEHFEQAFNFFDIDHSGQISYEEIAFFLENIHESKKSIREYFKKVDLDNNGVISREQFLCLLNQHCIRSVNRLSKS